MREPTLPHVSESCSECRLRAADLFPNVDFGVVATPRTYASGELIFHEGDEPRGAYIIADGVVRLAQHTGASRAPFVKIARTGDALSIGPLLTGGMHAVSAQAVDPTTVHFIERRAVLRLFAADIGRWQRTLDAIQRTHRIHPRSVDAVAIVRLSEYVLRSAVTDANGAGAIDIDLQLTTRELAQLLRMKLSTLQETADELERRRVLFVHGHRVVVTDAPTLLQIVTAAERRARIAS
jgi:CRP-like cAMP-binding protein